MEVKYTTPTNDLNWNIFPASTMTLESDLPLPPMSPAWTKYANPDTMSCAHNLGFDMELADMDPIESPEKTGLILRLKIKPQPRLVLKLKLKNKKVYKACSSFITPLHKHFNKK